MKIEKFKKDKSNTYKVFFENDLEVILYDDVIIKYNLLVNKEIDKKKVEEIINYNTFLDGYYKSIKLINKKLRTELEIKNYLKKLNINDNNIEKLIKLLYKDGYLNKDMYLKSYINDQYNLTNNGPIKIKKQLINLGLDEFDIDNYLNKYNWNERIDNIVLKKYKQNKKLSNYSFKNKVLNDIMNLGYEKYAIIEVLDNLSLKDDSEQLKKEMELIKRKYGKKYKDKELEFRVINYLYKKGFQIEEIKRYYNEN